MQTSGNPEYQYFPTPPSAPTVSHSSFFSLRAVYIYWSLNTLGCHQHSENLTLLCLRALHTVWFHTAEHACFQTGRLKNLILADCRDGRAALLCAYPEQAGSTAPMCSRARPCLYKQNCSFCCRACVVLENQINPTSCKTKAFYR